MKDTKESSYTERLEKSATGFRRYIDVQWPYRKHLQKLNLENVLDVGCGIGRNLDNLKKIGVSAVGVDHNPHSVALSRRRGFAAYTIEEFQERYSNSESIFATILVSHVLEHMTQGDAISLLEFYKPYLCTGGQLVVITPQESGYRTDPTHIEFMDISRSKQVVERAGFNFEVGYSFPFPRIFGKIFPYNEFVVLGRK